MLNRRINLFTYGSLMFSPVWGRVAKHQYVTSDETIVGYVRRCIRGEEYPAVIASIDSSSALQGKVYWDITDEDLARLDRFEGNEYERIITRTTRGDEVALYLFLNKEKIADEPWDPGAFEQTGMRRFLERYPGFE